METETTDRDVVRQRDDEPARTERPRGWWRGLSGVCAAAVGALAFMVLGAQLIGSANGVPGPGFGIVAGHLALAALALVAQRFADRRRDAAGVVAALVVLGSLTAALWLFWWT